MRKSPPLLPRIARIAGRCGGLPIEMNDIFISGHVMRQGKKLFLYIPQTKIVSYMIRDFGGQMRGIPSNMDWILIFNDHFLINFMN